MIRLDTTKPQRGAEALLFELVPEVGLEPTLPKETDFESVVYTNFTTRAFILIKRMEARPGVEPRYTDLQSAA